MNLDQLHQTILLYMADTGDNSDLIDFYLSKLKEMHDNIVDNVHTKGDIDTNRLEEATTAVYDIVYPEEILKAITNYKGSDR